VRDIELETIIKQPESVCRQEVFFQTHAPAAAEERHGCVHGVLVPRERLVLSQGGENAFVMADHVLAPAYAPLTRTSSVIARRGHYYFGRRGQ
jgi:hypothetical protein